IVTGIGFLGAGVIVKQGFTIHGLTTAASIWVVAAVGVVFGGGLFVSGAVATALTLGALGLLRTIEKRLPVQNLSHCQVAFAREKAMDENWLRELGRRNGLSIADFAYRLDGAGQFEYEFVTWSLDPEAGHKLALALRENPAVV